MSLRRRVKSLEASSGAGFTVALPRFLYTDGTSGMREKGLVAGVRVSTKVAFVEIWRHDNESLEELKLRAGREAEEELRPSVLLPFGADCL